jgi:hypothetical protein
MHLGAKTHLGTDIPRDIINLLCEEICKSTYSGIHRVEYPPSECSYIYRYKRGQPPLPNERGEILYNFCNCQKRLITKTMKSLREVCWKFSHVISAHMLLASRWSNCTFRPRHRSWLIRMNGVFAATDLQILRARTDWSRFVFSAFLDFASSWAMEEWIISMLETVDKYPLIIYSSDFGPHHRRKYFEYTQANISRKWWLSYHDGGYRPFSKRWVDDRQNAFWDSATVYGFNAVINSETGRDTVRGAKRPGSGMLTGAQSQFSMDFATLYPGIYTPETLLSVWTNMAPQYESRVPRATYHQTPIRYQQSRTWHTVAGIVCVPNISTHRPDRRTTAAGVVNIRVPAGRNLKAVKKQKPQKIPRQKHQNVRPGRHKLRRR